MRGSARADWHQRADGPDADNDTDCRTSLLYEPDSCAVHVAVRHCRESVAVTRSVTRRVLGRWQISQDNAEAVVLVVSELVTNAIEHALRPINVHLHREHVGNRVWVGVSDGGPATHSGTQTAACTEDEHGRGLAIVSAIAESHGVHVHPAGGTTRWASINAV
ncbi:ATP-binding protein [Streptomyces sp. NPDC056480]|uniref:ATP-binding protein n=1 Tax=Streptomyces sp. NPDC056480 TaxID=3345833 RepID=UPI0036C2984E